MTYQPEDYEQALQAWLADVAGVEVIHANDGGPRPDDTYVTLQVIAFDKLGTPDELVKDDAYSGKFRGTQMHHYAGTCSVEAIGLTARSVIEVVKRSIWLPSTLALNHAADLSIGRAEGTVDLTEVQGTQVEPRFQYDQLFGWASLSLYAADVIETANATEV